MLMTISHAIIGVLIALSWSLFAKVCLAALVVSCETQTSAKEAKEEAAN